MELSETMEGVQPGSPPKVVYPKKLVRLELDEYGYPGWWVDFWKNAPNKYRIAASASVETDEETERRVNAILTLIPAWSFVDENDDPLPRAMQSLDELPDEIWGALVTKAREIGTEQGLDPKSGEKLSPTSPDASLPQTDSGTPESRLHTLEPSVVSG